MKLVLRSTILFLILTLVAVVPSAVSAQEFIDLDDGQIDPFWNDIQPIVQNAYGYSDLVGERGEEMDIVNAWIAFEPAEDPQAIYFRVDGYYIEDWVSADFDCDNDQRFNSEADRSITFEAVTDTIEETGIIDGVLEYTEEFKESQEDLERDVALNSFESAEGEFVVTFNHDGTQEDFIQIEAFFDLSEDANLEGDLATCFGAREERNWQIGVRFFTFEDATPIKSQQVRTAVTLRDQAAVSDFGMLQQLVFGLILITLTLSLLIWRRKTNKTVL